MKPDKNALFSLNLIINPITIASLITNNNTHNYVSQYTSIRITVGSSSRLCPSITTSAAKFDRLLLGDVPYKQTLSPRSNFAHDNRETRYAPSPTMIVIPPKRPMHNQQHMSSPRYCNRYFPEHFRTFTLVLLIRYLPCLTFFSYD